MSRNPKYGKRNLIENYLKLHPGEHTLTDLLKGMDNEGMPVTKSTLSKWCAIMAAENLMNFKRYGNMIVVEWSK